MLCQLFPEEAQAAKRGLSPEKFFRDWRIFTALLADGSLKKAPTPGECLFLIPKLTEESAASFRERPGNLGGGVLGRKTRFSSHSKTQWAGLRHRRA